MKLGAALHLALVDLGIWIDPRLGAGQRVRPWWGLVVVILLAAGLLFIGEHGIWAVREATPHRETAP